MNMQTIQNAADLQVLYAHLTITITLPNSVGATGKSISNFDVMDKLRQMILPDNFSILKVSSAT
jgi:splicing factor, arginine/serine-rich 17